MTRWRIASFAKTEICLHPAMVLYALYALLTGHGTFMLLASASILLHEGAHAAVAALCGHAPARIELTPLGAVMRMEDEERLPPLKRCCMLLAGPGLTLCLCWLALRATACGWMEADTGRLMFMSNLSILLLNLLPVLPLDGGRIATLILGLFLPRRIATRIMRGMTMLFGFGLIAANLWCSWKLGGWNLSLAFAGCCMLYSASAVHLTAAVEELRSFLDRKIHLERHGFTQVHCIAVLHNQPVQRLVKQLPHRRIALFCCFQAGSLKPVGWMTEFDLVQHYLQQPGALFGELFHTKDN